MARIKEREMIAVQIDAESDMRLSEILVWCDTYLNLNKNQRTAYNWDFDRTADLERDNLWCVVFKFEDANAASMFRLKWI